MTGDGTNSYTYDAENRMIAATVNATGYTLRYDPLGRLWQVVLPTKTLEFVHDGDAIVKEYNGATPVWYVHGPGDDDPMIQYSGAGMATRYSLQPDAQGSIVSIADAGGAKAFIDTYDDYGITPTANFGRFQYTGQAWIAQLGLYYYKARMYSPTLGRFMQTDPIGYEDQNNLYAYVGNDPINGRDPSGQFDCGSNLRGKACLQFRADQSAAAAKLKTNLGRLNGLRAALAGGKKLSADQREVSNRISKYLGKGAGQDPSQVSRLINAGTAILGALNNKVPIEPGNDPTGYENVPKPQYRSWMPITVEPKYWSQTSNTRAETWIHAGAHFALNAVDDKYGDRFNRSIANDANRSWRNADSIAMALGFDRDDD